MRVALALIVRTKKCLCILFRMRYIYFLPEGGPMKRKSELPECPVATTVELIGSKWKILIIRNLMDRP